MRHGSLFSGIGGFDLASQWMGWENVFHCEWMEFPRKILHHYWPDATSYQDITQTDFTNHHGSIDILTGGFPCQPYSAAGKRKGKDDERHLWPHMLRAIRQIRPRWVVGENVFGIVTWNDGLVFEEVCAELESEGYEVQPYILPAAAVNAPHRRDRVWFVAHSQRIRWDGRECEHRENIDKDKHRIFEHRQERGKMGAEFERHSKSWDATYAQMSRSTGQCKRRQGQSQLDRCDRSDVQSDWEEFPTVAPICGGDDGIPRELDGITFPKWRAESIKGYGNAIVPQVALQIFRAIAAMESHS
jgi:DNA (cytosine-5)-methyltransferase 1